MKYLQKILILAAVALYNPQNEMFQVYKTKRIIL